MESREINDVNSSDQCYQAQLRSMLQRSRRIKTSEYADIHAVISGEVAALSAGAWSGGKRRGRDKERVNCHGAQIAYLKQMHAHSGDTCHAMQCPAIIAFAGISAASKTGITMFITKCSDAQVDTAQITSPCSAGRSWSSLAA